MLKYLSSVGSLWGFNVCPGVSITTEWERNLKGEEIEVKLEKAARRFYKTLTTPAPVPSMKDLLIFRLSRSGKHFNKETMPKDFQYFQENGWLESDYFYDVKLNIFKRVLGTLADKWGRSQDKRTHNHLQVLEG